MVLPPRPVRHELPNLSGEETEIELYKKYLYVLNLYDTDMDEWENYANTVEKLVK